MSWEATVLELLSASLLRPFILVAAAALVLRAFRVEHPASKHAVWTAVLIGMLILPLVSVTAPNVEFEALPQGTFSRFATSGGVLESAVLILPKKDADSPTAPLIAGSQAPVGIHPVLQPANQSSSHLAPGRLSSSTVLLWTYFLGLLAFGGYRVAGVVFMKRLVSRSRPCASGLLRESPDVTVPSVAGLLTPVVILPAGWRKWSPAARRAALAHEFAHVRRKDLWVLALSRWTKCIFWFHPLSWWVARRVSELGEMACDAAAVERLGDAAKYSRILVDFAGAVNRRGYRATLPGLAMFGRSYLGRRIDAVFAVSNGARRRLANPVAVVLLIGVPCLSASAVFGLTEASTRPLQKVQQTVADRIESVAQVATTQGVIAAIAEVVPPIMSTATEPAEPVQSASTVRTFLDQYCVSCHSSASGYANLNLADQDLNQIARNPLVWERVVLKFRSGLEPKRGVGLTAPDPAEVQRVTEWIENQLDRDAPSYAPAMGPHRLNRTEYGNAIHDVLGLNVNPALLLPGDDSQYGFDNIVSVQETSAERTAAYITAADRLAGLAMSDPASRQRILVCRPANSQDQDGCARRIITGLATRAYRRPVSEADVNGLMDVYRRAETYWYYDGGIRNAVKSILANPQFLYRTEVEPPNVASGQTYRISNLELASRLSYFLWSRGPDDRLLEVASRGQLSNPTVLEQETRRMLRDSRANALTVNFAAQWLWLRNLRQVGPMPSYPDFDEPLLQTMKTEAELFFASIVQEDRNVVDLITANYTFLNERLARHYGMTNISGEDFRRVTLPQAFDLRRGLLGKAALLAVTSQPERTSLTTRGRWVLHTFLGTEPPPPPPDVPPMGAINAPMREVMQRELSIRPACVACHLNMDPIGISLDNFDQLGKWRALDRGKPIDPVTELSDGTRVTGPADMRNAVVARSDQFVRTLTQRLLTYGLGRGADVRDMPLVRSIGRDAARDGNKFSAIVVGIVKSPTFQMSTKN